MSLPVPILPDAAVLSPGGVAIPKWESIPEDIRAGGNPWITRAERMHANNWPASRVGLQVKPDIDEPAAVRAITSALRSLSHSYTHKLCAVAYMLSEWFDVIDPDAEPAPPPPGTKRRRGRPKGSGKKAAAKKGPRNTRGRKAAAAEPVTKNEEGIQ